MSEHLKSCHCCGLIQRVPQGIEAVCCRCESALETWLGHLKHNRVAAALALSALILYFPAILLPFLRIEQLGHAHQSSLLLGVRALFEEGHYLVALIVLLFSIVLPMFKLSALLFLSQSRWQLQPKHRAWTYHLVEQLGRWGMLDVLLVAVMVAFIKLGGLVEFGAGPGLFMFAVFVLLSLCASAAFDPHCLWDFRPLLMTAEATPPEQPAMPHPLPATTTIPSSIPIAQPAKQPNKSSFHWIWLVPALSLLVISWFVISGIMQRGREIVITFNDGHGIAAGNELRYHGIVAGEVEEVALSGDLNEVEVRVRLSSSADDLAREGSQFWIVRPQADLSGISGLETIIGANYLGVIPGPRASPRIDHFQGIDTPPLVDLETPGGVEIMLQSANAEGLSPGVGVYYRNIRIGGIISSGLSSDGGAVEARVYIQPDYRELIREQSRFWNMTGVKLRGGLTELSLQVGPVDSLLRGGIGLAVPPDAGQAVTDGHRFTLSPHLDREWEDWQPDLTAATPVPPPDLPQVVPVTLTWKHDGFVRNPVRRRTGSAIPTDGGFVLLRDLLTAPDAVQKTSILMIAGTEHRPAERSVDEGPIVMFADSHSLPAAKLSKVQHPVDAYLVVAEAPPTFIAATRFSEAGSSWQLDSQVPVTSVHHGGAIVSAQDHAVIGILSVNGATAVVYPLSSLK